MGAEGEIFARSIPTGCWSSQSATFAFSSTSYKAKDDDQPKWPP